MRLLAWLLQNRLVGVARGLDTTLAVLAGVVVGLLGELCCAFDAFFCASGRGGSTSFRALGLDLSHRCVCRLLRIGSGLRRGAISGGFFQALGGRCGFATGLVAALLRATDRDHQPERQCQRDVMGHGFLPLGAGLYHATGPVGRPATAVVLMAATNRPEVLDAALLRPGRFDRQVLVDRPHREGRRAILGVHVRPLTLADGVDGVDLDSLAAQPPGFVGADLANLCNEAALLAARKDHSAVQMEDFQDAIERVIGGLEKKGRFISEEERRTVAYHESGRTLVGHFTPGADPVQKVSIVPRGRAALGYTLQMPTEDRYLLSRGDLLGRVRVLLGGRAAEQTVFGEISTGASDDLEKASAIVRQMLTAYGMSERLPNLLLVQPAANGFLGQGAQLAPHSAAYEQAIGEEQLEILAAQYEQARELLEKHREKLEALAQRLLEREKLEADDLREILGERVGADG